MLNFCNLLLLQINDRYEFPLELDLDRDNGKYLSPEADRSVRNLYMLHRLLCTPLYLCPHLLFCYIISPEADRRELFLSLLVLCRQCLGS